MPEMFRGKFFTGEKLKKYREFCFVQGVFIGAGVSAIGFSLGSGIGVAALGGVIFVGFAMGHGFIKDGNFDKIEEAIDQAGGDA
jgi:hypothetical protein